MAVVVLVSAAGVGTVLFGLMLALTRVANASARPIPPVVRRKRLTVVIFRQPVLQKIRHKKLASCR